MRIAQVNLRRNIQIPGLGNVMRLENVEAETGASGISVRTPLAVVLVPWEGVESVVTEWLPPVTIEEAATRHKAARVAAENAIGDEYLSQVQARERRSEVVVGSFNGQEIRASAGALPLAAPVPNLQPPPPKKGGRGR
jgi:hypothetical protein